MGNQARRWIETKRDKPESKISYHRDRFVFNVDNYYLYPWSAKLKQISVLPTDWFKLNFSFYAKWAGLLNESVLLNLKVAALVGHMLPPAPFTAVDFVLWHLRCFNLADRAYIITLYREKSLESINKRVVNRVSFISVPWHTDIRFLP